MQLIRQILILAAIIHLGQCLFCQYDRTSLGIVVESLLGRQEVTSTKTETATLKYCLEKCLETGCENVIFCNDVCWFPTKDIIAEVNDLAQNKVAGLPEIVSSPKLSYCVMYEYIASATTSSTSKAKVPMNQIPYSNELETSTGTYLSNRWIPGTTLQIQIPQNTAGSIKITGEKKLVLNIRPTPGVNSEDSIAIDSSSVQTVRLRKLLNSEGIQIRVNGVLKRTANDNFNGSYLFDIGTSNPVTIHGTANEMRGSTYLSIANPDRDNDRTVTVYVIPEDSCPNNNETSCMWSVSIVNEQNGFRAQVAFDLDKAYISQASQYQLNSTEHLDWQAQTEKPLEIEKTTEVMIQMLLNQAAGTVTGVINGISLGTVHTTFDFNQLYVSEGLTITEFRKNL